MSDEKQQPKTRVIIGLPGDSFSQSFLLSWTSVLNALWSSGRYDIIVSPGKSSFVPFARAQTLGVDVLRGKDQKPFNGQDYDVYVTIDSDVVFSPIQLIELIECTKLHPVVSGYYMMSNNKDFAVVKDWDKSHFAKNGIFKFLQPSDLEPYVNRAMEHSEMVKKAKEEGKEAPPAKEPEFINVAYAGMGFFACRKEVLDSLEYPYFHRALQRIRGNDGKELLDMCSEDVAFCKNIQDAGFDIKLHTVLRVGHEKKVVL